MPFIEIENAISGLKNKKYINNDVLTDYFNWLTVTGAVVRELSPYQHICVFFVPYHRDSQHVYLVHHKKANDWIPPGGHLESNEQPDSAVKRECFEELQFLCRDEDFSLFNISIKNIGSSSSPHYHYDLWYAIKMKEREDFTIDPNEFLDGQWVHIEDIDNMVKKNPEFAEILKTIINVR